MVLSLGSPLLVGVYEENHLIQTYETQERTSEALPKLMKEILESFTCKGLYFARGPGSFMAIKITYIFLRTLQQTLQCELKACDGFVFNDHSPIPAMGKLFFVEENGKILTRVLHEPSLKPFYLPMVLDKHCFSDETEPLYILPAV